MKKKNSIKSYNEDKDSKLVFRKGRRYLLNKKDPKKKIRQG